MAFTAVLLAPVAGWPGQDSSQPHAEKALDFAQRGDLKSAEAELRKAVALSPDDPALLTSLGGILGMEGDLQQANTYLAKAVKLNPEDPAARRNLAANQWQLGRLKEAHQNLDRLLRANSQDRTAIFLLGMVAEREKDYARSIKLLESIPEIGERQPEALVALASSYYHTSRQEDARSALKKLLSRPARPQVVFMGGRVAMDARDYPLAEALFSTIRSTYADAATVESQIAFAQYRQGHVAESEKTLRQSLEEKHTNKDAYLLLCKLVADRGAYDQALAIAAQGTNAFPDSYEVLSTKASLEMKLQYFSEAVTSFQRATTLHASPEMKRDLALAEWRAGNRKQAISNFEETIRQSPGDAQTLQVYGTLLLEDGSPEAKQRAIELLKKAIAADNSSVEARYQLANVELADGKPQPALQYLESAIKLDPNDSRLHFAMSRVYRRLGRDSDADKEMESYQKLKAADKGTER
ncbi:MAG TPA: tetratricopeptide repeat protein [Bryobacteraceae bacterium]|nr:tetratricopeptide repeat protein [Bryobacteraceae bacterium]